MMMETMPKTAKQRLEELEELEEDLSIAKEKYMAWIYEKAETVYKLRKEREDREGVNKTKPIRIEIALVIGKDGGKSYKCNVQDTDRQRGREAAEAYLRKHKIN